MNKCERTLGAYQPPRGASEYELGSIGSNSSSSEKPRFLPPLLLPLPRGGLKVDLRNPKNSQFQPKSTSWKWHKKKIVSFYCRQKHTWHTKIQNSERSTHCEVTYLGFGTADPELSLDIFPVCWKSLEEEVGYDWKGRLRTLQFQPQLTTNPASYCSFHVEYIWKLDGGIFAPIKYGHSS